MRKGVIEQIRVAYEKRGIIILTDPDTAGERIRRVLTKKFPNAQHAFVPRDEAYANDDIGIEQASPESIIKGFICTPYRIIGIQRGIYDGRSCTTWPFWIS